MLDHEEPTVATIRWTVTAEDDLAGALSELAAFARDNGMADRSAGDVELAASEAARNALRHAYAERARGNVTIDAASDRDHLSVRVADAGAGSLRDEDYAGRGIARMTALADRFEMSGIPDRGTVVLMEFCVREQAA